MGVVGWILGNFIVPFTTLGCLYFLFSFSNLLIHRSLFSTRVPPHVSVSTLQARACHRRSHSIVVSRATGQLQIDGPLLHDLPGNAVEHRKPGFVGALGDAQLVAGFLRDKGLVINGILSVHGLHLGSGLVC